MRCESRGGCQVEHESQLGLLGLFWINSSFSGVQSMVCDGTFKPCYLLTFS